MNASPPTGLLANLRTPLLQNAFYLTLNDGIGAIFGLAFWILAARILPTQEVGLGIAMIGIGILLSTVASLGFTVALVRFVPGAGTRTGAFVGTGLSLTLGTSIAVSGVFLVGAPYWTPGLAGALATPWQGLLFLGFVTGWTGFVVLDAAFVGVGAAKRVLQRGVFANGLRLALLAAVGVSVGTALAIPAVYGVALWAGILLGVGIALRTRAFGTIRWRVDRTVARDMARYAMGNHAVTLLGATVGLLLPTIVLHELGPDDAAYFYIAWQISNMLNLLPAAIQTSVLAESSRREEKTREHTRTGLLWTYALLLPATAATFGLASVLLAIFQEGYTAATPLLQVLLLNGLVQAFNGAYSTRLRVERRLAPLIALTAGFAAVALGGAYALMPSLGLAGAGLSILAAQIGYAAFAAFGMWDYRHRPRGPVPEGSHP